MCRVESLELELAHWKIPFRFVEQVKLSQIDVAGSHSNPARLGMSINQEVMQSVFYQIIEQGNTSCINAIVCSDKRTPYPLLDGVNRCKGILETEEYNTVDVYLVETLSEFELDWLAGTLNNMNGSSPLKDQRLRRALQLSDLYPDVKEDEIARRTKLKKEEFWEYKRIRRQEDRAENLQIAPSMHLLNGSIKQFLSTIISDEYFCLTVVTIAKTNPSNIHSKELIKRMSKVRNDKEAHKIINEFVTDHPPLPGPKKRGRATVTQRLRDDEKRLWNHWPGSVELYHLGSLDYDGLMHLVSIMKENQQHRQEILTYANDLIKRLEKREAA